MCSNGLQPTDLRIRMAVDVTSRCKLLPVIEQILQLHLACDAGQHRVLEGPPALLPQWPVLSGGHGEQCLSKDLMPSRCVHKVRPVGRRHRCTDYHSSCRRHLDVQGQVVWIFQILMRLIGLGGAVTRVATAPTLEEQQKV